VAPQDTIGPASRVSVLLVQILLDASARGIAVPGGDAEIGPECSAALAPVRAVFPPGISDAAIQAGLMAWSGLFGTVSFELFGQFKNVIGDKPGDRESFFAACVSGWASQLGIG
jgi:hypothetical protein